MMRIIKLITEEIPITHMLVAGANRCPAYNVRINSSLPRFCPLMHEAALVLWEKEPLWGPLSVIPFECEDHRRRTCPIQDNVLDAVLEETT